MATIRFAWDANPEPDVNGYKLYAGTTSGVYNAPGSPKSMGNVTTGTFDINADGNWFFALTATDTESLESAFSVEITGRFLTTVTGQGQWLGVAPTLSRGTVIPPRSTVRGT